MANLQSFIKSYWEYFLELEEQLIETKRYVAFDKANAKTYSIEYLKLYQAVCSEIDVVAKEISSAMNPKFKVDAGTNITKWGYEIQQQFPTITSDSVEFNNSLAVVPFANWKYEWATSKDNKKYLKLATGCKTPTWWKNYNDVKHQRIGLITGTKNLQLANQQNLISAFAALFLLEYRFIQSHQGQSMLTSRSKLFVLHDKK